MNRRDLLKMGASVATVPAAAAAQKTHWKPAFFSATQNETVIAVSDLIIPATETPGAKSALVNRYMDKLLADAPPAQQTRFTEDLAALDEYSSRTRRQPFAKCTPAQQTAILTALGESTDNRDRRVFENLKAMTVRVYYATEPGFQELNRGGRVPATFACQDTEHR
ncbi:MAG: gluconate 2-dehydrogenase subunit 3 family protein [Bryobacteraceae bacterium]